MTNIIQGIQPMTERERLIAFLHQRGMQYTDLARRMKWSPTFVFGFLGGAWSLTNSFRLAFSQTFGDEAAQEVFLNGHEATVDGMDDVDGSGRARTMQELAG
ncbi:MAG: hypothetical protein NTU85_03565 [Candidatus Kaiserbacteria bacterium]|nr:hypothetical protein [Candidatus Kaiserbacteria bacterium]